MYFKGWLNRAGLIGPYRNCFSGLPAAGNRTDTMNYTGHTGGRVTCPLCIAAACLQRRQFESHQPSRVFAVDRGLVLTGDQGVQISEPSSGYKQCQWPGGPGLFACRGWLRLTLSQANKVDKFQ